MIELQFSAHSLQRFAEFRSNYQEAIPNPGATLTTDGAKILTAALKSIMKHWLEAEKVLMTEKTAFWKWMKHGVKNEIYYRTKEYMVWVIVPDGNVHKVVTCTVPPKENRDDTVDEVNNKYGAAYLGQVCRIVVPWRLTKGVQFHGSVRAGYANDLPILFGVPRRDGSLRSYHFSLGNSTVGPIGYCGRVEAHSKEEAVALLRKCIPQELKVHSSSDDDEENARIEYIEAYLNPAAIKVDDIDEVNDAESR